MYYLKMQTVIKSETRYKFLFVKNRFSPVTETDKFSTPIIDLRLCQKLIVCSISISAILIFPESPKELEAVCNNYHSQHICNVW